MQNADVSLSICMQCRDGPELRDTDLGQRGGRHLARLFAAAFEGSYRSKRARG